MLSGDTKITPFLYNGQLGVMKDENGLYYMRARYYNVNIKRFINQDVVHGSISASQSLNRYSYVQGNPIKLTDPFGLSPLDRLNWKNVGHAILNGLGMIPVVGEAFDMANAIWYAKDGQYGMAALSLMSALPMIGNVASGVMTAAKLTTAAKIVSTACKVVSNAATFTQAAVGGISNAASIGQNILNGKLFSEDTAKNLVSFGINAFTAATSGKNLLSSSKELKKAVGDGVGNKWSRKTGKEPLLEYNLQFFAKSSKVWDYSKQFNGELVNFNAGYEIKNVIDEDLYLVQFYANVEVGSGRSLKYWTTFDEANGISTVDEYMNQMALLSNWGARDNVSIAKIPAGTKIKYAIGTAKEQVGAIESRSGGGLQLLFEQFDDGWIFDTRPLP